MEVVIPSAQEKIQKKAFELYLKRGGNHGQDLSDWLKAENEIKKSASKPAAKKPAPKKAPAKKAPAKKAPAKAKKK